MRSQPAHPPLSDLREQESYSNTQYEQGESVKEADEKHLESVFEGPFLDVVQKTRIEKLNSNNKNERTQSSKDAHCPEWHGVRLVWEEYVALIAGEVVYLGAHTEIDDGKYDEDDDNDH